MAEARPRLAYVCQYILAPDSRDLGLDVLRRLESDYEIHVFTQARGVGAGVRRFQSGTLAVQAIDFERRDPLCGVLDRIGKRLLGVRKLATDIRALRRFFREVQPEGVLIEGVFPWGVIAWAARRGLSLGRNVVVTRHTVDALTIPFDYFDRNRSGLVAWVSRRVYGAFTIRANSHLTAQWLKDSGAPAENVRVVPVNIAGTFEFQQTPKAPGGPRLRFASASRLAPMKALDRLILAFAAVVKQHPEAMLDIYGLARHIPGIGDYQAYLQGIISEQGLEYNVALRGAIPRDRVAEVLAGYDFHVASSHGETLNLVVAEAASRGIPSVVTRYCGIGDWVREHGAGLVCDCTVEGLAAAMLEAVALDDAAYARLQAGCRPLWEAFTPARVAAELGALLREVIPAGGGQK